MRRTCSSRKRGGANLVHATFAKSKFCLYWNFDMLFLTSTLNFVITLLVTLYIIPHHRNILPSSFARNKYSHSTKLMQFKVQEKWKIAANNDPFYYALELYRYCIKSNMPLFLQCQKNSLRKYLTIFLWHGPLPFPIRQALLPLPTEMPLDHVSG
jgi:hypothetical protein